MLSKLKELLPELFIKELWLVSTDGIHKGCVTCVVIGKYDSRYHVTFKSLTSEYSGFFANLRATKAEALAHMKELQEQAYEKAAKETLLPSQRALAVGKKAVKR